MPERYVFCGGLRAGRNRPNALHIDVNAPAGSPNRVNLEIEDLSKRLADNIPDVLTDMLEIAAYVYCADQFTTRGTSQMSEMGAEWRRQFRFKIPVRCLEVWSKPDVREALTETLGFLSEDEFEFEFVQGANSLPLQSYLPLNDPTAQAISPDEVVLFSGGLDSLAGAADAMLGAGKHVALVSHRGSKMIASKQNDLIAGLRERTDAGSFFYVPVKVNKGQEEAAEFTQRTRSLMFATLGLIVARMFGRKDLSFYENGVISINLPIAEHVLGARASRTTHPRVFTDCSRLFSLLLSDVFTVRNPFIWKTKSDVVRVLAQRQCEDLISRSFSCTRVREATRRKQHCGVCSQCIDRRFGILAAGLTAQDPADNYVVDLFAGEHQPGPALTMMESYVLRAQKLATMSQQTFVSTYGQIFRAIPHLPGSADENVKRIWELHRQHGQEVIGVVDNELKSRATVTAMAELPPTSLLSMVVSPIAKQPAYTDPVEAEPTAAVQAAADKHDYTWKRIPFAIDAKMRTVVFERGLEMGGGVFGLIASLAQDFEEDLDAGTFHDQYRFVKARTLARRLNIDEQSLRQRVSRSRKKIEEAFLKTFDRQLDAADVIQNQEWKGYRLNPYLLLVKPAQLRQGTAPTSQVGAQDVTSPGAPH
jgi:7-cyano-7-deazaguanine synthase in queuosine biosynthesis